MDDAHAVLDLDRCIGCGLCVSTCPTGSLTLLRKPESEQTGVPKDIQAKLIALGRQRGKLNTAGMISMKLRSTVDRLLAPR